MLFINVIQEEVRNGRCLGNGRLEGNVAERILTVHRNKSSSAIWNKSLDFIKRFLNSRFSGKIEIRSLWGGGLSSPGTAAKESYCGHLSGSRNFPFC